MLSVSELQWINFRCELVPPPASFGTRSLTCMDGQPCAGALVRPLPTNMRHPSSANIPCLSDHRRWSQRPPALLIASRELCNTSTHRCIPEQACSTTPRAQRLRWPDLRPLLAPCYVREPPMLVSSAKSPLQMLLPRAGCRHDHLRKRAILRPLFALGRCSPLRAVDAP